MLQIKSPREIENIKHAGAITREVLDVLSKCAKPGISTKELDRIAEEEIQKKGAKPAFKGYRSYPSALCTSINDSVVHGIPSSKKILREGDIISFDLGVKYNGFYADSAITVGIGAITKEAEKIVSVTKKTLDAGIRKAIDGNRIGDISHAVQTYVESNGFSVVRAFVGHGIGSELHEDPEIPNFGEPNSGARLREGMVIAIEPMVNAGGFEVRVLEDGWTAVTLDHSLSAHFEHTVVVRKEKAEILT